MNGEIDVGKMEVADCIIVLRKIGGVAGEELEELLESNIGSKDKMLVLESIHLFSALVLSPT